MRIAKTPSSRPLALLRALGVLLAIMVVGAPLAACSDDGHAILHTGKGDYSFNIEVVDTPAGRERGLMFRQSLAADAGMLFDFLKEQPVEFWMVNTFIPWCSLPPTARSRPCTPMRGRQDATPIPSGAPVQFVLEIAGGRAAEIGLRPGDRMEQQRVKKTP